MIQSMIHFLNENQGLIAVGIFLLGIIGFFIKRLFFSNSETKLSQKQKSGDNSSNVQAGRDISYGDK
jgi:hypothetical protein